MTHRAIPTCPRCDSSAMDELDTERPWTRPRPKEPPRHHYVQTTAERDAEILFGTRTAQEIADATGVDVTTARRWRRGAVTPPPPMVALLRLMLHGDLGALSRAWKDWFVQGEELHGPDGLRFRPGEIMALPYLRQLNRALEAQSRGVAQADWISGQFEPTPDDAPDVERLELAEQVDYWRAHVRR